MKTKSDQIQGNRDHCPVILGIKLSQMIDIETGQVESDENADSQRTHVSYYVIKSEMFNLLVERCDDAYSDQERVRVRVNLAESRIFDREF